MEFFTMVSQCNIQVYFHLSAITPQVWADSNSVPVLKIHCFLFHWFGALSFQMYPWFDVGKWRGEEDSNECSKDQHNIPLVKCSLEDTFDAYIISISLGAHPLSGSAISWKLLNLYFHILICECATEDKFLFSIIEFLENYYCKPAHFLIHAFSTCRWRVW